MPTPELKEWKTQNNPIQQQLFVQTVAEEDDINEEFIPVGLNSASLDLSHLSVTQQDKLHAIIPAKLFLRRNQG